MSILPAQSKTGTIFHNQYVPSFLLLVPVTCMRISSAELHDKVRHCLLHEWDPIGVREFPEAQDEYDSYVTSVCSLLSDGADAYKLRQHLAHQETANMGLSAPSEHLDEVVRKLLELAGQ